MRFTICKKCNLELQVDECDYMPGCREMEEFRCPKCKDVLGKVFTSGIPNVTIIRKLEEKNNK